MQYTLIMLVGIFIGARLLPEKYLHINTKIQMAVTILLLFTMGVSFGAQPNFFVDLREAGLVSLAYAVSGVLFSAVVVWLLGKLLLEKGEKK